MRVRLARAIAALGERIAPRVPDFHGMLESQCAVAVEALEALAAFTRDGDPAHGEAVRALEKEGDRRRAHTLETLHRSFATPIDRSSIYLAATAIDDVVNYAKTTVREVEILELEPDAWMSELAEELRSGGAALQAGFAALREDREAARAAAAAVHKSERNTEKLYRAAVAEAFDPDPYALLLAAPEANVVAPVLERLLLALRRREVYRHLSNTADRLDTAGRALLDIVMAGD